MEFVVTLFCFFLGYMAVDKFQSQQAYDRKKQKELEEWQVRQQRLNANHRDDR